MLYDVICSSFVPNTPFTAESFRGSEYSPNYLRQQICALVKVGKLQRYCPGVYYRPAEGALGPLLAPTVDSVLALLYTRDADGAPCGFFGGYLLGNRLRLTTQVPLVYEVYTNKASRATRCRVLNKTKVILRKPPVPVTAGSLEAVRLLTLIKDIDRIAETDTDASGGILRAYMQGKGLAAASLVQYLDAFPAKTAKNLVRLGILRPYDASE